MRSPIAFVPYLLLAAFVAGGYIWHMGDMTAGLAPVPANEDVAIGGPFTLTDQNGQIRHDSDYRGKYMLVFFGFTNCPDVCPTTLSMLTTVLDRLGGKADLVAPIFISVDPERDTPAEMKNYLSAFGPRFVGLTGSIVDVTAAAHAYRVYFKKRPAEGGGYSMDHSSVIYLMGPDGKYLTHYSMEQGPDAIAADLQKRI